MPLDILLFAAIAVFFVWKLRQVLGTRTGEEQERPNPFIDPKKDPAAKPAGTDKGPVIEGEARELPVRPTSTPIFTHPASSVAGGLAQIRLLDPGFDEKKFIASAKQAYTMIVEAFAADDRATLKLLLKPDVYNSFISELDARTARGEVLSAMVSKITTADIAAARTEGHTAVVTVDFSSEQVSTTKNQQGEIVDGDPVRPIEIVETWIFERDTSGQSPNWFLVATR